MPVRARDIPAGGRDPAAAENNAVCVDFLHPALSRGEDRNDRMLLTSAREAVAAPGAFAG